jgi:lipopolysaccharide/colanic/teichoic acid biosynthesis glycosyltransferase
MSYLPIKRAMDFSLAIILGVFFFPICVFTAIAIKLESPSGPIFADTPKRLGKNGRPFYPYKFRSMIPNAHYLIHNDPKYKKLFEEYKKNSYKLKEDPRWTKVGKFIRKYSIDEMPQFINVLKGEMSVVGPRPYYPDELEIQVQKYPNTKESIKLALSVRPGITGQWQVSGRSDINFDKRIDMDAHYAKHVSLWYDLKILFKTPLAMLSGKGAV